MTIIRFIGVTCLSMLASCATTSTHQPLTPAQVAQKICAPTQAIIQVLQTDPTLAAEQIVSAPPGCLSSACYSMQPKLAVIASEIDTICKDAATVTSNDVQSLMHLAFDIVLPIVQKTNPKLGVDLAVIQALVEQSEANIVLPTPAK